jgi:RHS repeat-associated protein
VAGTYVQVGTAGTNVTAYADATVSTGNTYYFRVQATNATGDSGYSNEATITVAAAQLYFIEVDHLNTPRLVTNDQQQAVWRWDQQEPFGVNVPDENPSSLGMFAFPLRFPGQYADKETNLFYNYFRDYDSMIGRYIESDPVGLEGGLNTFIYTYGSPLNGVDLDGTFVAPAAAVTIATVRAGAAVLAAAAASTGSTPGGGGSPSANANCPTCDKDFALYVKCSALYDYPYWSLYAALQSMGGGRAHSPQPATEGPCSDPGKVLGKHYNVRGKGSGGGSTRLGSIVSCPCCEDRPSGAVLREKFRYIP